MERNQEGDIFQLQWNSLKHKENEKRYSIANRGGGDIEERKDVEFEIVSFIN